ncbi:hypothetical protein BDP27DRAFT_1310724 [Rhodocollybia butyracea]|uniref:Uncharacterized protein n=1 Tax=Rhodocollybia butyracea TaxID=206335 RepID=A0A9P5UGX8_9AGAR|nr:hypothetical protein BDP27DRAFT_1310724 [Rhodocollybia butyracea]
MHFLLLFIVIISSILAARPLPMNQLHRDGGPSSQVHPPIGTYGAVVKVKFLDGKTGGHNTEPTKFPDDESIRDRVDKAIKSALGVKVLTIVYHGIFKEDEPNYYIVIGGPCPEPGCSGWMVEGDLIGPRGWKVAGYKMYYTGISLGDQFSDAEKCVGVNPPLVRLKDDQNGKLLHKQARRRWEILRNTARDFGTNELVLVKFLDGETGGHTNIKTNFLDGEIIKNRVDNAITAALDVITEIEYRGEFKPLGEHKIVYYEVIGGKCWHGCFAWMAEGDYTDSRGGKLSNARMYYTGISLGDRFSDAENCVGVNPTLAKLKHDRSGEPRYPKALERWKTFKDEAKAQAPSFPSDILTDNATFDEWFNSLPQ